MDVSCSLTCTCKPEASARSSDIQQGEPLSQESFIKVTMELRSKISIKIILGPNYPDVIYSFLVGNQPLFNQNINEGQ